jgi:hypothetical protein
MKLAAQHTAAELVYRTGVTRMKEMPGQVFERAWRLVENRRVSLVHARQVLREHEQDQLCGMQESFAAITRWPRPILTVDGVVNWERISNPRYASHSNLGIGRLRDPLVSFELLSPLFHSAVASDLESALEFNQIHGEFPR